VYFVFEGNSGATMPQRSGLGKGLDALIPGGNVPSVSSVAGGVQQVSVDLIQRNPRQPRVHFHDEELVEMAQSIREHGVIQPLIVTPKTDGTYTLIAGERRLQAAQKAGLQKVPVITRLANNQELLELALVENLQRADLNPLEEAEAYRQLIEEFGLSHEAVAKRVGKSRVAVTNTLGLLLAAPGVKQALIDGKISEGHARALRGLHSFKAQESVLAIVLRLEMSVRQTEGLVRKYSGQKLIKAKKTTRSADLNDIVKKLQHSLGTKVSLRNSKKGGSVTIYYYSNEELDALLDKLL
jgi:ParB family chromosome partitioning protein